MLCKNMMGILSILSCSTMGVFAQTPPSAATDAKIEFVPLSCYCSESIGFSLSAIKPDIKACLDGTVDINTGLVARIKPSLNQQLEASTICQKVTLSLVEASTGRASGTIEEVSLNGEGPFSTSAFGVKVDDSYFNIEYQYTRRLRNKVVITQICPGTPSCPYCDSATQSFNSLLKDVKLKTTFNDPGHMRLVFNVEKFYICIIVDQDHKVCCQCYGTVNIPVDIAQIVFNTRIKNELRPGINPNRKDQIAAAIIPDDVFATFELSNPARARVVPDVASGSILVSVFGQTLSTSNRDTMLIAKYGDKACNTVPVTVVIPADYKSDKHVTSNLVQRTRINGTIRVFMSNYVTIGILDQFGVILGTNWNGLATQESIDNINWAGFTLGSQSTPLNNGIVIDYVTVVSRYPISNQHSIEVIRCTRPFPDYGFTVNINQLIRAVDDGLIYSLDGANARTNTLNSTDKIYTTDNSH